MSSSKSSETTDPSVSPGIRSQRWNRKFQTFSVTSGVLALMISTFSAFFPILHVQGVLSLSISVKGEAASL